MAELYAQLVRDKKKTIKQIPVKLYKEVLAILILSGDYEEK